MYLTCPHVSKDIFIKTEVKYMYLSTMYLKKPTRRGLQLLLASWSFIASKDAMPLALVMDPTAATATAPGMHPPHQS